MLKIPDISFLYKTRTFSDSKKSFCMFSGYFRTFEKFWTPTIVMKTAIFVQFPDNFRTHPDVFDVIFRTFFFYRVDGALHLRKRHLISSCQRRASAFSSCGADFVGCAVVVAISTEYGSNDVFKACVIWFAIIKISGLSITSQWQISKAFFMSLNAPGFPKINWIYNWL